jgi:ABC-type amino acid transport substrate-binding protein
MDNYVTPIEFIIRALETKLKVRDNLLKEINEWMTHMGFDGRGWELQQQIKKLYWPDLVEEEVEE